MPTPDASQFTQKVKYSAIQERKATGGPKLNTHMYSYVPPVTMLRDFLPSFSNKDTSRSSYTRLNIRTGAVSKPKVPGGNLFGMIPSSGGGSLAGYAGSLYFRGGSAPSYLSVARKATLLPGTGDYTIEFYMNMDPITDGNLKNTFSYPFALSYGTVNDGGTMVLGISIEKTGASDTERTLNVIYSGNIMSVPLDVDFFNSWHHIAIMKSGGSIRIFIDGTQQSSDALPPIISVSTDITTLALNIGTYPQNRDLEYQSFIGYISNFRMVLSAVYTLNGSGNFTKPSLPLTLLANTSLFLEAKTEATYLVDSGTDSSNTVITQEGSVNPWSSQLIV